MLAGLAVSYSNGDGNFFADRGQRSQSRDAELSGSLTSVYPYLRVDLGEQLLIWGLFGHGWGTMAASKEAGAARNAIGMQMGAVGARGSLLKPEQAKGFELAVKLDTFLVGMGLESDAGARITDADASRTRLLLEGSRDGLPAWGGVLGSSVEFGLRRDAGAAETGVGLELGGSLRYINLDRGLTVSVTARRLMAHKDDDYREWGVGGMIEYDPGAARRGLSVRMVSSWGTAPSGTNRLWSQSPSAGFSRKWLRRHRRTRERGSELPDAGVRRATAAGPLRRCIAGRRRLRSPCLSPGMAPAVRCESRRWFIQSTLTARTHGAPLHARQPVGGKQQIRNRELRNRSVGDGFRCR